MKQKITNLLSQMKPLRVMLAIIAIILCIFSPAAGTKADYEGIAVLQTLIMPALTPLVFMVLLLDALMNRVWLVDAKDDDAIKFRNIMRIDLLLVTIIFIVWIPYFIQIW